MYNILIIDDEIENGKLIEAYALHLGHQVTILTNPLDTRMVLQANHYDIILLDVMMPQISGLELINEITQLTSSKVIFLSALGETSNRIRGLKLGAVEYLAKPFSLEELFLKIDIILNSQQTIINDIHFNAHTHVVTINNNQIKLTNILYLLLYKLVSNQGTVLSREYLLKEVWGITTSDYNRTVDTHILKLRNRLGADSFKIVTVIGKGYKYEN